MLTILNTKVKADTPGESSFNHRNLNQEPRNKESSVQTACNNLLSMKGSQVDDWRTKSEPTHPHVNFFWGLFFIMFGSIFLLGFMYAAILSKLLPKSEIWVLSFIQRDWYYCLLVPLTLPILVFSVYLHWLSMKLFKHA